MNIGHSLEDLFSIEHETHLKEMEIGLVEFRNSGFNHNNVKKLFRAAHSLKGAARLVKKELIEKTTHDLEGLLKEIEERGSITNEEIAKMEYLISSLGGKINISGDVYNCPSVSSSSLLHITTSHISELIQLASELSVLTRRIDIEACSIKGLKPEVSQDIQRAETIANQLQRMTYQLRLTNLSELTRGLHTITAELATSLNKNISLKVYNVNTLIDRELLRKIEPCLIQLLKNAIDHGFEDLAERQKQGKNAICSLAIKAKQCGTCVEIEFKDDGRGVDLEKIRKKVIEKGLHDKTTAEALSSEELLEFLFLPGFSTKDELTAISGRGVGLDIVKSTLLELGGDVSVRTATGKGTSFILQIPSRIASFKALIFKCAENFIGVPLCYVNKVVETGDIVLSRSSGQTVVRYQDENILLADAARVLQLSRESTEKKNNRPIIILDVKDRKLALIVDSISEEREVVINPLDSRFEKVAAILGIAADHGNKLISIVNPEYIIAQPLVAIGNESQETSSIRGETKSLKVLVVDDSLTVRELQRRLLIQQGFDCDVAVDGIHGLEKLKEKDYSLVITDIDMPRLNGFDLITAIRSTPKLVRIPLLVISYKDRSEDKELALNLGANAFLNKGSFKDDTFAATVRSLLRGEENA